MAWLHLPHSFEQSAIVEIPTPLDNAGYIPLRLPAKPKECLCFCSYQQLIIVDRPEQWLYTVSVSDGEKELSCLVVNADSKFTAKMLDKVQAIAFIQRNDDLRVCLRLKGVLESICKVRSQAVKVVYFSIDDCVYFVAV